eukprot:SAG11_NODE_6675_length_1269_cov_14.135897_1_plen_59_part_10
MYPDDHYDKCVLKIMGLDDASWEPEANLRVNASGAVDDYDLNHPRGANKADSKRARTKW